MEISRTILLQNLRRQTEIQLQKAVTEWQMLPPETLSHKTAPDRWSAAQCLEHLNIYGRYYLPALEKAIRQAGQQDRPASSAFRSGWLGAYFTRLMQPQPGGGLKTKMQAPKNARPCADPDARAMLAEFIDQQEKMLQLLDAAASVDLGRVRVPISIAPWIRLKLGDTLGFVVAHTERHMRQAERELNRSMENIPAYLDRMQG